MQLCQALLCWFSLVAAALAHEQVHIGIDKQNVTLDFDDLPTNDSGIGYDPQMNKSPLHYKDFYFQSFTVVDVAKAMPSLPNPVDILCARSAPNALFSRRRPGSPWPRFSLHPLTNSSLPRDPNVTFTMHSVSVSLTGSIPGKPGDALAVLYLNLFKLPPDESWEQPRFPALLHGAPVFAGSEGRASSLVVIFGPGPHASFKVDWSYFRRIFPGMATKVDTFEVYAEVYRREGKNGLFRAVGDWEVCLDDVDVEISRKTGHEEDEQVGRGPEKMFLFVEEDGEITSDQERGIKLAKELQL